MTAHPPPTPAERLNAALTAAHDAAYTEAFMAGLDALDRLATHIQGVHPLGRARQVAIRSAFIALQEPAKTAAQSQRVGNVLQPALISYACYVDLQAMAKARYAAVVTRLGGTP